MPKTYLGIDVSEWQRGVDWKEVKDEGVEFAILRCGFGRHSHQVDSYFEENYKNAKAAGMPVGTYHYSYATTVEKAEQEADFCLSLLKGKQFEYPIAFDIEDSTQTSLSMKQISDIIRAFCTKLEKAGYYVVLYSYKSFLESKVDADCKKRFDVWLAHFVEKTTYKGQYGMWQYSSKGKVNGVNGNVDMNTAYKDYPEIIKSRGLNGFTKATTTKPTEEPKPTAKPVTKPVAKPAAPAVEHKAGQKVVLENVPLYASATTSKIAKRIKKGTYYIYDGIKINGRYRITNKANRVGKKPVWANVTGFVKL